MKKAIEANSTYWLSGIVIGACLFGLVMVASSSQAIGYSIHKDTLYFFKRQLIFLTAGGIVCYSMSRLNYKKLIKGSPWLFLASCALLVAVMIPGIGKEAGGSSRWIPLGFFNLQPSEVAKFTALIMAASIISKKRSFRVLDDYKPFLSILIMAALVLIQPDFGTAVIIILTALLTLLACGIPWRQFIVFSGGFTILAFIAIFSEGYRRQRFLAFLNPWADIKGSGFQIIQSLLALGSGGITGVGLSLSKQKFCFLPAAYTDFIFAIIGEELGLFGTMSIVGLFIIFTFVGMGIASSIKEPFGKALAAAVTLSIIVQAAINLGACVGVMPITGVPLPLISYGGSSLIMTLAALGILINISGQKNLRGA